MLEPPSGPRQGYPEKVAGCYQVPPGTGRPDTLGSNQSLSNRISGHVLRVPFPFTGTEELVSRASESPELLLTKDQIEKTAISCLAVEGM